MNNNASPLVKKRSPRLWLSIGALGIFVVFLALVDNHVILSSYELRIIRLCGIYAIAALSMNLVNGFTGQFSLGQGGFMAIGAYTTALCIIPPETQQQLYYVEDIEPWLANLQLPFLAALLLGGLLAAFAAFLIGFPVLRLRGDYLAIATLGFSEIIRIVITNWTSVTNGSLGLKSIPDTANVWWTTGACALAVVFMLRLMKTSYGRAFKAVRDNDVAAEAMGISLFRHKMISFVIGGFMAGVSGGLVASVVGAINPIFFRFTLAYEILLIVVLGGQGSITGSVVGAALLTVAKEWLRFLDNGFNLGPISLPAISGMRMLVFSILLMVVILFYRKGLFGSNEFSWNGLIGLIKKIKAKLAKKTEEGGGGK